MDIWAKREKSMCASPESNRGPIEFTSHVDHVTWQRWILPLNHWRDSDVKAFWDCAYEGFSQRPRGLPLVMSDNQTTLY